jgi:hypothetical protein
MYSLSFVKSPRVICALIQSSCFFGERDRLANRSHVSLRPAQLMSLVATGDTNYAHTHRLL